MIPENQGGQGPKAKKPLRARQLARLHALKKQIGMDEEAYRAMLREVGGVRPSVEGHVTAGNITNDGIGRVLDHLSKLAGEDPLKPSADVINRDPQLAKIDALLRDAGRNWGYVLSRNERGQSLLSRLTKKDRLPFCTPADLGKVVAALTVDAKRREMRAGGAV
jgi:phage gp16-like protein